LTATAATSLALKVGVEEVGGHEPVGESGPILWQTEEFGAE
jgi:hypothetical protein